MSDSVAALMISRMIRVGIKITKVWENHLHQDLPTQCLLLQDCPHPRCRQRPPPGSSFGGPNLQWSLFLSPEEGLDTPMIRLTSLQGYAD